MADDDVPEGATRTIDPRMHAALGLPRRAYLVAYESGTSTLFHLPSEGELVIGRSAQADICLPHDSISRRHVTIKVVRGVVEIADLNSHNGTRVNGVRIEGTRRLVNDDVIGIGALALTFKCDQEAPTPNPILDPATFQQRLLEEVERAARYARPLTLLVAAPALDPAKAGASLGEHLRLIDVISIDTRRDELAILMPETPAEASTAAAEALLRVLAAIEPRTRIGIASSPDDGFDADTLMTGARTALREARPGGFGVASETPTRLEIGDRIAVVAEPAMAGVFSLLRRLAGADLPVLVIGETGVGKDIAASAIHYWSRRASQPFVAINCAAIPESLVESELFGHERGAFSGAIAAKPGRFEAAHGGTVFLDEVGELSPAIQAKLLRVLESKRVTRVGAVQDIEVDIRLVAATNLQLLEEAEAGRFRRDLYYRLSAATVTIPPLRERRREIPLLVRSFVAEVVRRSGRRELAVANTVMAMLTGYEWPGNVRELRNVVEYAVSVAPGATIELAHLPPTLGSTDQPQAAQDGAPKLKLADEIRELERRRIIDALEAVNGNQTRAAEMIGMPLRTFVSKLKQHGIVSTSARPGRPSRTR